MTARRMVATVCLEVNLIPGRPRGPPLRRATNNPSRVPVARSSFYVVTPASRLVCRAAIVRHCGSFAERPA
jgi:hypothetical protein